MLPEFKDRDEKLRAQKAVRLEPVIERALERRVDNAPPMPEGYVMDALAKAMVKQMGGEKLLDKVAGSMAVGDDLEESMREQMRKEIV